MRLVQFFELLAPICSSVNIVLKPVIAFSKLVLQTNPFSRIVQCLIALIHRSSTILIDWLIDVGLPQKPAMFFVYKSNGTIEPAMIVYMRLGVKCFPIFG